MLYYICITCINIYIYIYHTYFVAATRNCINLPPPFTPPPFGSLRSTPSPPIKSFHVKSP